MTPPSAPDAVIIYGAGKEAEAALGYFAAQTPAPRCTLLDDSPERARALAARFPKGVAAAERLEDLRSTPSTLLLRAPSVRPDHGCHAWARASGVPCTTFTGFWLARHRDRVAATVTGTKGKSTTTVLLAQILSEAGTPTSAVGNLGVPPRLDIAHPEQRFALEMSSYQLTDAPLAARVHVITNLHHEHLDWHGGFEPYWRAKRRPLELDPACFGVLRGSEAWLMAELPNDYAVVDVAVEIAADRIESALFGVRADAALPAGVELSAVQRHNLATALTAARATRAAEPNALCAAAARVAASFPSLPSRQAVIGGFAGRTWVDDALATIPEATLAALERWRDSRVRLVVGGKDRGVDLAALADRLRANRRVSVHAYGPTGERLAALLRRPDAWADRDLAATIADAFAASAPGDVILFSPAAASFEPGWTYEQRSQVFRAAAERLGANGAQH
jgi:UDP-N-acetylmuramoylalanine--D-glutamate ligase